jgi:hypothetical protein
MVTEDGTSPCKPDDLTVILYRAARNSSRRKPLRAA